MTLYGKILVLANFGLSVMAMIWALLFYFERVDWTDAKTGELAPRKALVEDQWTSFAAAEASWREVHGDLLLQENYRATDRPFYATEVENARTKATDLKPARTVVYDKGVLVLAPVANEPKHLRPKMVNATDAFGKPLASLTSYIKAESDKRTALVAQQQKLQVLVEEDKRLTNLLTPEEGKGLRQRIEDEKVKVQRVDEELAIVQPLRINTAVENYLILQRDKMLRDRIEELKAAGGVVSGAK